MKAFFFTRHVREKILLVAFTALIAAVWLSAWSDRLARFWHHREFGGAYEHVERVAAHRSDE